MTAIDADASAIVASGSKPGPHRAEAGPYALRKTTQNWTDASEIGWIISHRGDDAFALDLRTDHETRDVGEKYERNVEGVTHPHEGAFVGAVDEQHAAFPLRLR